MAGADSGSGSGSGSGSDSGSGSNGGDAVVDDGHAGLGAARRCDRDLAGASWSSHRLARQPPFPFPHPFPYPFPIGQGCRGAAAAAPSADAGHRKSGSQ